MTLLCLLAIHLSQVSHKVFTSPRIPGHQTYHSALSRHLRNPWWHSQRSLCVVPRAPEYDSGVSAIHFQLKACLVFLRRVSGRPWLRWQLANLSWHSPTAHLSWTMASLTLHTARCVTGSWAIRLSTQSSTSPTYWESVTLLGSRERGSAISYCFPGLWLIIGENFKSLMSSRWHRIGALSSVQCPIESGLLAFEFIASKRDPSLQKFSQKPNNRC